MDVTHNETVTTVEVLDVKLRQLLGQSDKTAPDLQRASIYIPYLGPDALRSRQYQCGRNDTGNAGGR